MPNSLLYTIILGLLLGLCYYLLRQQRYVLFYLAGCMAFGLIFGAALPDAHRLKKDGVPVQARISRLDCQNRGSVDYVYDVGSGIYGGSTTGAKIGRL